MIDNKEKEKMAAVLPHRYSPKVKAILADSGVTNAKGEPFSDKYISHIFNGRYENKDIETAILVLYDRELKSAKHLARKRAKIKNPKL